MKKLIATIVIAAACGLVTGCASVYGGMIGAGIGSFSDNAGAGMLIGAGVGGLIDIMD